ncbi:MAG: tubulin-like doman-containing protein [Fimbriiglobus sp.]
MNWLREPDTEPLPGYVLVAPLGTGGFGEVWKCVAPGGINKAIKFVFGNLNSLGDDAAKAEQEFKAIERVKEVRHPFVLSMERIDIVGGELLIVMELADKSLFDLQQEQMMQGHYGIPRDRLLRYLSDAAEGLDHLIEVHNLQHLDVKPKNLFLIANRVKVADFGLVKHLERQSSSGLMGGITPIYAAPETFANKISKHSDQYSLAVMYVELLTGRRPFNGKNIRQLAMQHMTEAPDLTGLTDGDRLAVAKALAKNPEERFPSCSAFIQALNANTKESITPSHITPAPAGSRPSLGLPPDSTPLASRTPVGSVPTLQRKTPPAISPESFQRLGEMKSPLNQTMSLSVSFRPEEGVLRPAILIGVGSFGRKALQQIRCRLLDRVGEPSQVPCFRFISIDVEPESSRKPYSGGDASLLPEHTFHAPLQPVTAYRRRQLDQLLEWLPREKLYSIPRSLKVEGSRALGRLAFADNYLRFVARLRQEIQICTHPESVNQSADHTGLLVRTKTPSVYVFASAGGGTSGMILDVGHAVRRTLDKYGIPDAIVTGFIFAGATEDPSSPPEELSNIFATLTELNHFSDPEVKFSAQYAGLEGQPLDSTGMPFHATYLLPMATRSTEAFRDCISHLAGYVTHDLTTPLGTGLEKIRRAKPPMGRTPFRGFGTFGVWYPRGLLVRSAARQLSAKFLRNWTSTGHTALPPDAERVLSAILEDDRLTPEELQAYIATQSASGTEGNPAEATRVWRNNLTQFAENAARRSDPQSWAEAAWDQCRDLVGLDPTAEGDSTFRRGRLSKALDLGLKRSIEAWQNELLELTRPLEEMSGARLAICEQVLTHIVTACRTAAQAMEQQLKGSVEPRHKLRNDVLSALENCKNLEESSFNLFGNRTTRALRNLAERIKTFTDHRLKEDLNFAAKQFYRRLQGVFEDRLGDITFARTKLSEVAATMEAYIGSPGTDFTPPQGIAGLPEAEDLVQNTLHESNTMRVVLPYGEDHLDRSAAEMLSGVSVVDQQRLELILTRLVIEPRGGILGSARNTDLETTLASPMIEQATAFLTNLMPSEDVTAVELSAANSVPGELARRVQSYVRAAAPLASGPAAEEKTYVMVPDTEAGQKYAAEVRNTVKGATTVPVRGSDTDLLFCREQACLRSADLFRLLEPCWEAYTEAAEQIEKNPHSRFDIPAWLPLVE